MTTRSIGKIAVALGAALSMPAAAENSEHPVRLLASPTADGVNLKVVGSSPIAMDFAYRLEVDGRNGGNRVRQDGRGRLTPGQTATVADVTVSAQDYSATLSVEYDGGSYVETSSPRRARD